MSRLNLADIQQEVASANWKLKTTKYKNLDEIMEFECPKNHKVYISLKKWRRHAICPLCSEKETISELQNKVPKKNKDTIRILALDDSTTTTGWAIFDNGILVTYGKIIMGQKDVIERIAVSIFKNC